MRKITSPGTMAFVRFDHTNLPLPGFYLRTHIRQQHWCTSWQPWASAINYFSHEATAVARGFDPLPLPLPPRWSQSEYIGDVAGAIRGRRQAASNGGSNWIFQTQQTALWMGKRFKRRSLSWNYLHNGVECEPPHQPPSHSSQFHFQLVLFCFSEW